LSFAKLIEAAGW